MVKALTLAQTLTKTVHVRLTEEEFAFVQAQAQAGFSTAPMYLRKLLCLDARPELRGRPKGRKNKPKMVQAALFPASAPAAPESSRRASDPKLAIERDAGE